MQVAGPAPSFFLTSYSSILVEKGMNGQVGDTVLVLGGVCSVYSSVNAHRSWTRRIGQSIDVGTHSRIIGTHGARMSVSVRYTSAPMNSLIAADRSTSTWSEVAKKCH